MTGSTDSNKNIPIAVTTLGCKVNQCDSAAFIQALEDSGYSIVAFSEQAELYIINTCVVTLKTEAQSRQVIRRALRTNPRAQVLVTGCYAQKSPDELRSISARVHVAGNAEKKQIPSYVPEILNGAVLQEVSDIHQEKTFTTPACSRFLERTRAFLKIQDGCNSRCSYCIVPSVRGPSRSLPPGEVKRRLHGLVQSGYREIVFTGIHLGAYGLDLTPPVPIVKLLESLEEDLLPVQVRLRLSSIEPREFTDDLIAFLSRSRIVCPHLHMPLQSADPAILKKMNRPYTPEYFRRLVHRITSCVAGMNIGIDVIAGFPGESDEQFLKTLAFLQNLPAAYLHVFPYSRRTGTPASRFDGQVPEPVKKQRVSALRQLSLTKKQAFYAPYLNRELSVIIESRRDRQTGRLKGFSRNYIPVLTDGDDSVFGKHVSVRVTEIQKERVFGIILP